MAKTKSLWQRIYEEQAVMADKGAPVDSLDSLVRRAYSIGRDDGFEVGKESGRYVSMAVALMNRLAIAKEKVLRLLYPPSLLALHNGDLLTSLKEVLEDWEQFKNDQA